MQLGNGRWETAKFNSRLQVEELGLGISPTDASLWKVNYEYGEIDSNGVFDPNKNTGNIAKQTLNFNGLAQPFVQAYHYDSLYRLKEAKETPDGSTTPNWTQNFDYDRYGNRISFSQNISGTPTSGTPGIDPAKNRFNTGGFVYDRNGNVITDVDGPTGYTRNFLFNGDNKQREVKLDGPTIAKYFYDGEGNRVRKQLYSGTEVSEETVFVYSSGKLIAEYSTTLPLQPSVNYTTTDHLGTPRIITNQVGDVKSRRDFMPFGEDIQPTVGSRSTSSASYFGGDDVRQKFTGYQKDDETHLDFAEARMYENRFGRFTAVDPLLASGHSAKPQTFNRYTYVTNAPLVMVDPKGLIGDYYNRSGEWIGHDNKNDGLFYYADVVKKDGSWTYIKNVRAIKDRATIDSLRGMSSEAQADSMYGSPSTYKTISERSTFYFFRQQDSSNRTRWAGAASEVSKDVSSLEWGPAIWLGYSNNELAGFARTGNRMILEDAYPKFFDLRSGSANTDRQAFDWDAMTTAQEQTLIQPLYDRLSGHSFSLLESNVKDGSMLTSLFRHSDPFPRDYSLQNPNHRWAYGMRQMGYFVTPDQMPDPGRRYTSGEMHNRFNPTQPVGPVVIRVQF